jgi:hypothetical protein
MSNRGDIIRGAGGYLNRNNQLGIGIGQPHGGEEGDIRVQMVDSAPRLYARAGGQWYQTALAPAADANFRGIYTFGSDTSYIKINTDDRIITLDPGWIDSSNPHGIGIGIGTGTGAGVIISPTGQFPATAEGKLHIISERDDADLVLDASVEGGNLFQLISNGDSKFKINYKTSGGSYTNALAIVGSGAPGGTASCVGIGTESPVVPLEIETDSSSGENIALLLENTNTTLNSEVGMLFRSKVGSTNTDFEIGIIAIGGSDADLVFQSDGSNERVRFTQDGKVGIGETSPDAPLHIKYALVNDDTPIMLLESTETTATSSPDLKFYRNSSSPADDDFVGHLVFTGNNDADEEVDYAHIFSKIEDTANGDEDGALLFRTKYAGGNSDTMFAMGKRVGINETTPDGTLDIHANEDNVWACIIDQDHSGGYGLYITTDNTSDTSALRVDVGGTTYATNCALDVTYNKNVLIPLGHVGIGTTDPTYPLEVVEGDGTDAVIGVSSYSNDSVDHGPTLVTRASNSGTVGTLTTTPNNKVLGDWLVYGVNYAATPARAVGAGIRFRQEGTLSSGNAYIPTDISFMTCKDVSSPLGTRMIITAAGRVGIGGTPGANNAKLQVFAGTDSGPHVKVFGASSTGARASITSYDGSGYAAFYTYDDDASAYVKTQIGHSDGTKGLVVDAVNNRVGIGTASPTYQLDVEGSSSTWLSEFHNTSTATDSDGIRIMLSMADNSATSGGYWMGYYDEGGIEGGIRGVSGNGVDFDSISDRRLKDTIVDIPDALSIIAKFKPRNYYWKSQADDSNKQLQYGFIADEFEEVFAYSVSGKRDSDGKLIPDALKSDGSMHRQMMDQNRFTVPVLVKAVQELIAKVTALESA